MTRLHKDCGLLFGTVNTYRASMNTLPSVFHNKIKSIKYKVLKPKPHLSAAQLHRKHIIYRFSEITYKTEQNSGNFSLRQLKN